MQPRLSIAHLMIGVAVIAVLLMAHQQNVLIPLSVLLAPLWMFGLGWWIGRHAPGLAFGVMVACSILALGCNVWFSLNLCFATWTMSFLVAWFALPMVLGFGTIWANQESRTRGESAPRTGRWLVVVALMVVPGSAVLLPWPFLLLFAVSRPALDRLADRVATSGPVTTPQRAGAFRIVSAGSRNGNIALFLDDNPRGPAGFFRITPPNQVPPIYGTDLVVNIPGDWEYHSED